MTAEELVFVSAANLRAWVARVLERASLPVEDAAIAADVLVSANLRGVDTHGVIRLPPYFHRLSKGAINPKPKMGIVMDSPAVVLLDGDNGLGLVTGVRAMREAIQRVRVSGVGVVGVRNSGHFGAAAYYAQQASAQGQIGMAFSNATPIMAPWGSVTMYLGNNPFAFAAPGGIHGGIVVDMATSQVAWGKVLLAARAGQKIPLGWATDRAGQPTDDPNVALAGLMLPLGGHKGYGLALMVEVLCGVLTGALTGPRIGDDEQGLGHFFIALDISRFLPVDEFESRLAQLVSELHACQPADGVTRIYVPGEIEMETAARRQSEGIPLPPDVVKELLQLAEQVKAPFTFVD